MRRALPGLLAALTLAACSAAPPAPEVPAAAAPPPRLPAVPLDPCGALEKPLRTLRQLAAVVPLGRSMPVRPLRFELFVAELAADQARALSVKADDAELARLAADTGSRLARIGAGARVLAAATGEADAEAARTRLLEEMERGELLVGIGEQRCAKGESMAGHLPSAALARVVRSGHESFKKCYEAAHDPSLRGTVRIRFVVARDGAVGEAVDADRGAPDPLAWGAGPSTTPLRDPAVSDCVVAAFRRLVFPRPEGGSFSATTPIELGSVVAGRAHGP